MDLSKGRLCFSFFFVFFFFLVVWMLQLGKGIFALFGGADSADSRAGASLVVGSGREKRVFPCRMPHTPEFTAGFDA